MAKYAILELTDVEARVLVASKQKRKPIVHEAMVNVSFADLAKDEQGMAARLQRMKEATDKLRLGGAIGGIILPKQQAIVRTVQLPSTDDDEIRGMVQFEAEKVIPFDAERHIVSYAILREEGEAGSHVLLSAVDGPVIDHAVEIAKAGGIEPSAAEVSCISLTRGFLQRVKPELPDPSSAILLLNVSRHAAEISIIQDGALEAARSQSISLEKIIEETNAAGTHWLDVEVETPTMQEWLVRLMRFVRQTIDFAQREHEVPAPALAYVCGEGSQVEGLVSAIGLSLGIPVLPYNPFEGVTVNNVGDQVVKAAFANAVGMLDRLIEQEEHPGSDAGRINLLPPIVIEQQAASERRVMLAISATMVFITLVLVYLTFDMQTQYRGQLASRYRQYNREMRPIVDDIELKRERLEIIDSIKKQMASPLELMDQLTTFPGMGATNNKGRLTLTNLKYSQTGEVAIAGMSLDLEDVSSFADFLEKLTWRDNLMFAEVGIPQSQPSESLGRGRPRVWTFSINARLYDPNATEPRK
jgi:Tfp pilus assembly PilM family ATPase